jgi:hypothetical protein
MLGRDAAYKNGVLKWNDLLKSTKRWDAKINLKKMG